MIVGAQQASSCVAFFESQREKLIRLMGSVTLKAGALGSYQLTREERDLIVALCAAGNSVREISERVRRSHNACRMVLIDRGLIKTKKRGRGRLRNSPPSPDGLQRGDSLRESEVCA